MPNTDPNRAKPYTDPVPDGQCKYELVNEETFFCALLETELCRGGHDSTVNLLRLHLRYLLTTLKNKNFGSLLELPFHQRLAEVAKLAICNLPPECIGIFGNKVASLIFLEVDFLALSRYIFNQQQSHIRILQNGSGGWVEREGFCKSKKNVNNLLSW